MSHADRQKLIANQRDCYSTGSPSACATVQALETKDRVTDQLIAYAAATCKGSECTDVSNFIQKQITEISCPAPSSCPDTKQLQEYWKVAQTKAQGLEAVYPETWVMDVKAVVDLAKFGIKFVAGGVKSASASLNALAQLKTVDRMLPEANLTAVPTGVNEMAAAAKIGTNGVVGATVITPEMETKILFGERVTNASGTQTNRLIGAHGGEISNSNTNYAVEVISVNTDGTRNARLVT